jgi:hypothetical protein
MKVLDIPSVGKLGLTVTWRGRNGMLRRAYVVPRNPQSDAQLNVRNILAAQAGAWRGLTDAQRHAWSAEAALQKTKATLGQSGPLTGLQLFTKINTTLAFFGQPVVDTPPQPPAFPDLAPQNLVITNTGGVVALKLTCPTDPGSSTIVRASAPQSAGISRPGPMVILGVCPAPVAGAADITGLYSAKFGTPGTGTRVFVKCNQFVDGYQSIPRVFNALVPA